MFDISRGRCRETLPSFLYLSTPRNLGSVIRLHPYFILMPVRLVPAFVGDVACCIRKKCETR